MSNKNKTKETKNQDENLNFIEGIEDPDEYLKLFETDSTRSFYNLFKKNKVNLTSKKEKALEYALDIRKFEIDLYWKRATYFWAFIAASFTAYFLLASKLTPTSKISYAKSANQYYLVMCVICLMGFVFSVALFCTNKGSKFWQNNWERHVDYLEDDIVGPLYKLVTNPLNMSRFKPTQAYPFSVSKINQILSSFILITWIIMLYLPMKNLLQKSCIFIIITELFIVVVIVLIYFIFGQNKLIKDLKKQIRVEELEQIENQKKQEKQNEEIKDKIKDKCKFIKKVFTFTIYKKIKKKYNKCKFFKRYYE
ncbi:hypothetical protein KM792_13350 [Clostridium tyrobutyricum]|uniref:RipA family octameric membrane protein n=1 Tax=Clostridium tyrobutyricum TaxID=1519 RepID=UPI001C386F86|nr:hypothetical protein [Clostridium tyrobutyricum]MBV4450632.1 hypothetical protein [Clostridium tyrobutyricum]